MWKGDCERRQGGLKGKRRLREGNRLCVMKTEGGIFGGIKGRVRGEGAEERSKIRIKYNAIYKMICIKTTQ